MNEEDIKQQLEDGQQEQELEKAGIPGDEQEGQPEGDAANKEKAALQSELEAKEKQYQELFSSYQRLQADFENFRKRARREKEDTLRFAAESLVTDLLPVLDNFQRALQAEHDTGESFKNGVEMIQRQLVQVLQKQGLEKIKSQGEIFDPNRHQAVMQLETDQHDHNTVVQELQTGYSLGGKVIRPSMVQVANNPASEKEAELAKAGEEKAENQ